MNNKYSFIAKHLFISLLPLLLIYLIFIPIEIFIFHEPFWQAIWSNSFFIFIIFSPFELFNLFAASKRAKRLGMNLWTKENKKGNLTHTILLDDTIMNIKEKLNHGNWKYKIIDEKMDAEKTILLLKHYQIPATSALFIELSESGHGQTSVSFKANSKKKVWWSLVFTTWAFQLKQIEYFQNVILQQEELNRSLSLIE